MALLGAAAVVVPIPTAVASATRPASGAHSSFVASYDVILTGGIDRERDKNSGGVVSHSHDTYQGRGILSLKQEQNGQLVPSSNSFAYQSATWMLNGTNGSSGSFSCSPPVTTTNGTVDASGWVLGGVMYIRFKLVGTHEHNDDYNCGANFTGFATDSTYEADSLQEAQDAQPGGLIVTNADNPTVGTLESTQNTGDASNTFHSETRWTITITKQSGPAKNKGGPSPGSSRAPTPGSRAVCTINGTSHADVLTGTSGDDVICAYGGNDRIDPRGGKDLVFAGPGNDVIKARDHQVDRVDGGPGRDRGTFDKQPRDIVTRVERAAFG